MLVKVFAATLISLALSCQNIRITAKDGSVVVGRSMEFSELPVHGSNYLWTEPAKTPHTMPDLPNCKKPFQFNSDFKLARFHVWYNGSYGNSTLGGINDEGMVASTLYFTDYARFKAAEEIDGDNCQNAIPQTQVATYVLAKYRSVRDLKKDLKKKTFPKVWEQGDLSMDSVPYHWAFHDATGMGLVLEYTEEGMTYFENSVGAMTNSPDYKWHMTNLKNYPTLQRNEWDGFQYTYRKKPYTHKPSWVGTGFSGMPGDYSSPSRFIKAATMVSHSGKARDADHAVNRMFHMLNAADLPKGIIAASSGQMGHDGHMQEHVDYTWWISVYDLSRRCVYYRAYDDLSVKRVCLENIPNYRASIELETTMEQGIKDMTDHLEEMEEQ